MARIPLPIHSYEHLSKPVGVERLVNCMAERAPPEGKAPAAVMQIPGIKTQTDLGSGPGRGMFLFQGILFAISGNTFYSVSASNVISGIGTIPGTDVVSFAQNPTQLVICSESGSSVWDGNFLTPITDPDFDTGVQCCGINSYVLFRKAASGQFFSSDFADALSYDALFFATAEGSPDNLVGIISDHQQAILMGSDSGEIWSDHDQSGFPFARDANGFFELGCAAGKSLAKLDNSVVWLASDLTVRRLEGLTPVRISQHGVEQAIATYSRVDDAYGFSYAWMGHTFYVLTFPTVRHTWVFDAATSEWHERESYGQGRWRPCAAVNAYGKWYVQDFETGKVGTLDQDTHTEWDQPLVVQATFPTVSGKGELLPHAALEIAFETGAAAPGVDPQATLQTSDDSGRTWRTKATKSLGKLGRYKTKVIWDALGSSYERVYRVIAYGTKIVISDAYLTLG